MDKYEKIKGPVIAGKSKKQEIENISNNHFFCVLFGTFIFFSVYLHPKTNYNLKSAE